MLAGSPEEEVAASSRAAAICLLPGGGRRVLHSTAPTRDIDLYAVGVPATGDPVAAGVTGGGGGGVIGAQALAGGGPACIWIGPADMASRRRMTPSPLLAPSEGKAT